MGVLKDIIDRINTDNAARRVIGKEEIAKACEELRYYKQGKHNLEQRIICDEEFYKLRYRENIQKQGSEGVNTKQRPTTAWLLNSVVNKHADLMDNYPEAVCLPREKQDEEDAKCLTQIMPVVMEYNGYEKTYSDAAWYFIKHGMAAQGVFWDSSKQNGLGDISIKNVDILNLFWEPGVCNIQESRNLFYVSLMDNEVLEQLYPNAGSTTGDVINVAEYIYDDTVDNTKKTLVIDWYYKKQNAAGVTVLHYVKFAGDTVLFASENEEGYENGFYEHGEYPFTLSVMYPEAGTPAGFGIISVCRDPQQYIDTLDGLMLDYVYKTVNPRFWCKKSAGVRKEDFLDWSKPIVEVEGDIDEEKLRQINVLQMGTTVENIRQMKVDELKETSSNRDFSQGGTSGGITSGAAIATLQEAGNKTSRDMIKSLYRSYTDIVRLTIELIRQFYTEEREFRITGADGNFEFVRYNNANIGDKAIVGATGEEYFRKPVFDISVKAQKQDAYSKMTQNETAVNLYNMGVFAPQNATPALAMLEIMDFEGKEKVRKYVQEGQTLLNVVNQQQQQIAQLTQRLAMFGGIQTQAVVGTQEEFSEAKEREKALTKQPVKTAQENAQRNKTTPYMDELAKRARVSVNGE